MVATDSVDVEYAAWLERLEATYQSVAFCCWHRIGDRNLANEVSAQVIAGLIGKPKVFKYFGLPFSGRIARLAERGIEDAKQGELTWGSGWEDLIASVRAAPPEHKEVLVHAFLEDADDEQLATALQCDPAAAKAKRDATLQFWEDVSKAALPPADH